MARALSALMWALAPEVPLAPSNEPGECSNPWSCGFAGASEETQPRCGATLDGVQRRKDTLVPRARQAPDGRKEGGNQGTDIRMINRRLFLAPALPMDVVQEDKENAKKSVANS